MKETFVAMSIILGPEDEPEDAEEMEGEDGD